MSFGGDGIEKQHFMQYNIFEKKWKIIQIYNKIQPSNVKTTEKAKKYYIDTGCRALLLEGGTHVIITTEKKKKNQN